MNRRVFLLTAILLMACDLLDYSYRGIENVDPDFHMPNQRKTLFLFEQQMNDHFGLTDRELYKKAEVYYVVDTCDDIDQPSFYLPDGETCVYGVMWRCEEMFVARHDPEICNSSLIHEFAHCLAQHHYELQEYGYSDPQHQGEIWRLVQDYNKEEVCPRGW